MYNKEVAYNNLLISLKKTLSDFGTIYIVSSDLSESDYDPKIYSDNLHLYRDENDKFIYLYDRSDDVVNKVLIGSLKIILQNVVARLVEETHELNLLEEYLSTEDGV
ncbi:hypothetical protein [Paenibacillus sinopodophylli]|uniref:hypothetical protein n=1 Tax=Paenibacillus sinopodophylli TaxID=1837342 RepID=UPI00110D02D4|nr:hypothetical protein [Paenibacillus sinopodophylli]